MAAVDDEHEAILRGHLSGAETLIVRLSSDRSSAARAEAASLSAALWLLVPERGRAPAVTDVQMAVECGSARGERAGARLAIFGIRRALLELDSRLLFGFAEVLERAVDTLDPRDPLRINAELTRRWPAVLETGDEDAEASFETLSKIARERSLPHLVVEANTQLAFSLLVRGDLASATQVARRASRMARTEALPQEEYLANAVLARIRREAGMPHLATHILGALRRTAPSSWWPLLDWERVMAGAVPTGEGSAFAPPASRLFDVIASAAAGRRDELTRALDELGAQVRGLAFAERDLADLRAAVDPEAIVTEEGPLAEFLRGERALPPRGLHGIGLATARSETESDAVPALSVGAPAIAGRRVLTPGAGLVRNAVLPKLDAGQRRHIRTETALAVLVLHHDEVLAEEDFFQQVYEFAFQPRLHRGALEVLLHRARAALGDLGTLAHAAGEVKLELARPIRVPDPRSAQPLADRILGTLAREGPGSALDAARRLGVSVRTVQAALRDLVESGACSARKEGRSVSYEVEDTTFTEPTLKR